MVARSSDESQYRNMVGTTIELTWLSDLLDDLGIYMSKPPSLHCGNLSAISMTMNLVLHAHTKQIITMFMNVWHLVLLKPNLFLQVNS